MAAERRAVVPSEEQLKALIARGPDGPIVMVNLLKFRRHAAYSADRPESREQLSGREAYLRYGAVALKCVTEAGGGIVWGADQKLVVIGGADDEWDQVVCVRYPSKAAFMSMIARPDYLRATYHREAGLERTALLCCEGGSIA